VIYLFHGFGYSVGIVKNDTFIDIVSTETTDPNLASWDESPPIREVFRALEKL